MMIPDGTVKCDLHGLRKATVLETEIGVRAIYCEECLVFFLRDFLREKGIRNFNE